MTTRPTCIVILGMGRSGTSAIAGVLHQSGISFGTNLIPPDRLNPRGYFEDLAVVTVNRSLLKCIGSGDGDFMPLHSTDWNAPAVLRHLKPVSEVLRRTSAASNPFALKDPRLCRVWPVWHRALTDLGIESRFILPVRHPLAVVQSLKSIGTSTNAGLLWWAANTLDAELYSQPGPRCIVSFEDFVNDPASSTRHIRTSLDLPIPATEPLDFVEPSLRHFGADTADAARLRAEAEPELLHFAELLYRRIAPEPDADGIDRLRSQFNSIATRYAGWRSVSSDGR